MQYGFLQWWDCCHNLLIKLGSASLMIMDKRKLWDVPSYKSHFACPETRKHQNLLHAFRAISQLSWWNEQVQGRPKKQVTFLHQHCYNPSGFCHWRWGCGFKGSFYSLLPNWSHTTSVQVWASHPQEGPARLPQLCGARSPVLSCRLCWLMHKGWCHPPGRAGVTLCPVLLPLLQALSPGMQQFLPLLSYFPPSHLRPSESSSQKEISPFPSYIHLYLASQLTHSPGSFQKHWLHKPLPCPSFQAMLAWTEAHPFGLLPSSPLQANLPPHRPPAPPSACSPLLWTCVFQTQSPNYSRIMTWRKMCNHSIFLSPLLPSLLRSALSGEGDTMQFVLCWWLSFPDLLPEVSVTRTQDPCWCPHPDGLSFSTSSMKVHFLHNIYLPTICLSSVSATRV